MAKDLGETKRIVFYETDDNQARFRIKLKQDGLRQSHFFRMIIALYIDNDQRVLDLVEEYKEKFTNWNHLEKWQLNVLEKRNN